MTSLRAWQGAGTVLLLWAATAITSPAQNFESLVSFDKTNGATPFYAPLVQAADGNLYGTTSRGGKYDAGTIFKMTTGGKLTTLHDFHCTSSICSEGALPWAGVIQAANGNLYGTTTGGGAHGAGTVYKISLAGKLTTLYSFCAQAGCADGAYPEAGLIQGIDGSLYGTTNEGGNESQSGTVFKITTSGHLTTLHRFCAQTNCPDGALPSTALVQAKGGNLYGSTSQAGSEGSGTVFRITPAGRLTTVHSFNGCDDPSPSWLLQARDGNLYGTTVASDCIDGGTFFRLTPAGHPTTLHRFCTQENCADGASSNGLIQGRNGNFYGTASQGGNLDNGTIFEITSHGHLTALHHFDYSHGSDPTSGVIEASNGKLYGTTSNGGSNLNCSGGCGTIFSLH